MRLQKLEAHFKGHPEDFVLRAERTCDSASKAADSGGTLPTFMLSHTCLAGHLQWCSAKSANTVLPGVGEGAGCVESRFPPYLLKNKKNPVWARRLLEGVNS